MIEYIGPIAALVIAVLVTVVPSKTQKQWGGWWRGAIICLGVLAAAGSTYSIRASHQRENEMRAIITGGDNFCYLKADLAAAATVDSPMPWWLINHGQMPIEKFVAHVARYKPNLAQLDSEYTQILNPQAGWRACPVSPVWSGISLGRDHYLIDLQTPDKYFVEDLKIAVIDGKLQQSIVVTSNGVPVYTTNGFVQ